jgi:hypothetical protein
VRVPVVYTRLLFALATAYRLLCAQEATGGEHQRSPSWDRHAPGSPGTIWAHTQGVNLLLEPQENFYQAHDIGSHINGSTFNGRPGADHAFGSEGAFRRSIAAFGYATADYL